MNMTASQALAKEESIKRSREIASFNGFMSQSVDWHQDMASAIREGNYPAQTLAAHTNHLLIEILAALRKK